MSVIAIACSDIHLSHTPPSARSVEPDWYAAQKRVLCELTVLQMKYQGCPILVAGDIFDRWNSPASLINFALTYFPSDVISIPGQHDLPNHSLKLIENSAYQTLCITDRVIDLSHGRAFHSRYEGDESFYVTYYPFPWGMEVTPIERDGKFNIALIHAYIWNGVDCYEGAPVESNAIGWTKKLQGYDVAIFGDNHKGFMIPGIKGKSPTIINCGSLMRRNIDQIDYRPMVWLIYEDGGVEPHHLDVSHDKYVEPTLRSYSTKSNKEFLAQLKGLDHDSLNFREILTRNLSDVSPEVVEMVLECLG